MPTRRCPCFSVVPEATYEARSRALEEERCHCSKKPFKGPRDEGVAGRNDLAFGSPYYLISCALRKCLKIACVLCTLTLKPSYPAASPLSVSDIFFAEIPPVVRFVVVLLLLQSSSESRSSRHSNDSVKKREPSTNISIPLKHFCQWIYNQQN